jgi:hypothetical protein
MLNRFVAFLALMFFSASAMAQAAGGSTGSGSSVSFDPIVNAANWSDKVSPAIVSVAGAIAVVLVVVTGIKYVLGAIRRA